MTTSRRRLIAAGAVLALPGWTSRRPRTRPVTGRAAYAGGALRAQLAPAELDAMAAAATARLSPYASDRLDARLERTLAAMRATAITAAVARSDGTIWTQGVAASGAPPRTGPWPGLSEPLVATAVLQLIEERKLAFETTVERWAPEVSAARHLTIEDLLSHTSGLALTGPPASAWPPGLGWAPSAADAVVLGRVIEALDGAPLADAVRRRTVERLELHDTRLGPGAAGGTLSVETSAWEAVKLLRGLLSDGLTSRDTLQRRLMRLYPTTAAPVRTWQGLGLKVTDLAADSWNPADAWVGWAEPRPGGSTVVAYSVRKRAFAALDLQGAGSAESALDLLLLDVEADPGVLRFTPSPPRKSRRKPRPPPRPPRR